MSAAAWLAIIIAGPFVVLVLIGFVASVRRSMKSWQQRERQFEQRMAEQRRRIRGLH